MRAKGTAMKQPLLGLVTLFLVIIISLGIISLFEETTLGLTFPVLVVMTDYLDFWPMKRQGLPL